MLRTSIVLGIIALLLLGYIAFVERGSLSTGELEQRKDTVLPALIREKVDKLEIQRKGVTTVLSRELDKPDDDEAALWHVQEPYRAKADQNAVDSLLGELEWLNARRKLGKVSDEDRVRFGLDKPRIRLSFTVGKRTVKLVVGNESPQGDGVYVQTGDPPQASVVGKDFLETLSQDPGHYHSKELHDGMLVATTRAITLRDAQGERGVRKRDDGLWAMAQAASGLASASTVEELVHALDELRTQRFVAEHVKDLHAYGLDRPRFELIVEKTKLLDSARKAEAAGGKKPPPRTMVRFDLRVGGACEGHKGESYVSVDDSAEVHCASDADLNKLNKSTTALRESKLLPVAEDDVESVHVEHDGSVLTLTKKDADWSYACKGRGVEPLEGKARAGAVDDWLKALASTHATRFDVPKPPGLAEHAPFTLEFGRGKDKPAYKLRVMPSGMDLLASRADEPNAVAFPASTAELLEPEAARFRPLTVLELKERSLRTIAVARGSRTETLAHAEDGTWSVQGPIRAPADSAVIGDVTRSLASLEALRFVADAPSPEHGLATPAAVITLTRGEADKPPQKTVLELGAETEGGRFADVRGRPGVFVLASHSAEQLLAPLVSRTLIATPIERLAGVQLTLGTKHAAIERSATGELVAAAGSALNASEVQALGQSIATLRASRVVGYDPVTAKTGLERPYARIQIGVRATGAGGASQAASSYALAIGADAGNGARFARRSDQPVVFVLPRDAVEHLLAPVTASAPEQAAAE